MEGINFINKEKAFTFLIKLIEKNYETIIQTIKEKLLPMFFDNMFILPPKHFYKLIKEEINIFLTYLKTKNIEVAFSRGKHVSFMGLNESIVLTLFNIFQNLLIKFLIKEKQSILFSSYKILQIFTTKYLLSFIRNQYIQKNKEQRQLYDSKIEEIAEKERQLQESKLKALEEQNNQRLDFLINFAHETKLPLSIILNTINRLKEEAGRRKLPSLSVLENEIRNLINMVIDILDNEKIFLGKMIYDHNEIICISTIVAEKIELFKGITTENNILITSEIESDVYIRISPYALDRILNNIVDNAIKYNNPKEGNIHIALKRDNNSVMLTIRDTGIGIPKDQLSHIFMPYYQSTRKKRNIQGIGAGLPIVKSIMNEVSGHITINSKVNKGTIVYLIFNKETVKNNKKHEIKKQVKLTKSIKKRNITLKPEIYESNKRTILVVEDSVELLSFMQSYMSKSFNFYFAREGQKALRKLKTMPKPDVIISDIMMDVMDGYDFYNKIKEIEDYKDIPFIFLTAKTGEEEIIKGLSSGAVDYIEKPFDCRVLKEKILSWIKAFQVYKEKHIERMGKKIVKAIQTDESNQVNYDLLYTKYNLTVREQEIVCYVIQGWDNKEIAEHICISPETVKIHIANIKRKCKVKNKVQLTNLFCN